MKYDTAISVKIFFYVFDICKKPKAKIKFIHAQLLLEKSKKSNKNILNKKKFINLFF